MACLWIFIVFLKLFFIWPLTRVLGRWWRWRGRRWCSRWWGACSTVLLVQVWSSCLLTLLAWAESPSQEVWKTKSCQIVIFWKWHTFLDFKVEFFFNEPRCLWKGNRMFFTIEYYLIFIFHKYMLHWMKMFRLQIFCYRANIYEDTPLHLAACNGKLEIARELLLWRWGKKHVVETWDSFSFLIFLQI